MTLASAVYSDSEDINAAIDIAREMIVQSRARPLVSVHSNIQTSPKDSDSRPSGPNG